jgi:hypothetical protein
MKRARDMAARLPLLYREGEVVGGTLEQPAQQVEIALEDALEVQRSHFFHDALELEEAAGLAALLDFAPEPWQTLRLFRAWVDSQRDAILGGGGVTVQALRGFAERYAAGYQQATGARVAAGPPVLIENPPLRRVSRPPVLVPELANSTVPLTRFTLETKGLDETVASFLLVGLPAAPESMPLVANLTTGDALLFRGNVGPGQRLWLRAGADRSMTAYLEARDVTARLLSIGDLLPGTPWSSTQIQTPARAIRLARGENVLWFLPVAHFDELGLDRFLLALADLALAQGRWDDATFDHALFYQEPAVMLKVTWVEAEPASIELRVPAQSVRRRVPAPGTAEQARDQLALAIETGVKRLKAAGIRSTVRLLAFSEMQGAADFLTAALPMRLREVGSTGADRIPDKGGVYGVTEFGESTFR